MGADETNLRGVLFDLDGTLLDTYELLRRSFHHAVCEVFGEDRSMDYFDETIGQPLFQQFLGYTDDERTHAALLASYRAYNATIEAQTVCAFPGIEEALQQLRAQGWRLGVVTSKMNASARRNLDLFGLVPYFDCIVGSDDVTRAKPDPEPIRDGAQLLGFSSQECIYVGDSPFDIMAGNAAGAPTVAVHWGQHTIGKLRREQPTCECVRPADLPQVLRSLQEAR